MQLEQVYIAQRLVILKDSKIPLNIDAVSIQNFLNQQQTRYEKLTCLNEVVTQCTDDRFSFIIGTADFKCKNKQFTLAQYCVDLLFTKARQSLVFGTDQCKLMVSAFIIMNSLMSEQASQIDVVFLSGGFSFICFTATPTMSELELKIEEQFKFMQYSYSLFYAAVIDKLKPFMVDVAFKVTSLEQKAAHLRASQVIISASLLQQSLTKAIVTAGIPSVVITGDIDQKCQRQLDKMNTITQLYDIIVQMTTLGTLLFRASTEWEDLETNVAERPLKMSKSQSLQQRKIICLALQALNTLEKELVVLKPVTTIFKSQLSTKKYTQLLGQGA
ncbi:UNKNOWN [Stylonychia lemnae]|uniref:Uncharacterized protein n=1 Tax=Stylonychia lemnae TaxID=5949 RepID=A0A078ATV3_STYLE|nr:UNKNOWN [Stylonychia lemnae]|eukprot:CDW85860.1 UNKNOWN [Stylonychia lemnae]